MNSDAMDYSSDDTHLNPAFQSSDNPLKDKLNNYSLPYKQNHQMTNNSFQKNRSNVPLFAFPVFSPVHPVQSDYKQNNTFKTTNNSTDANNNNNNPHNSNHQTPLPRSVPSSFRNQFDSTTNMRAIQDVRVLQVYTIGSSTVNSRL